MKKRPFDKKRTHWAKMLTLARKQERALKLKGATS